MQTSEQINELAAALALAQAEICGAKKDSANPFFKSKYADLASVTEACKEPLTKNGLSVVQVLLNEDNKVGCETQLNHKSGQWIRGKFLLTPTKGDPQAAGSAVTYARRYALAAMVGVVQEDDDANKASAKTAQPLKTENGKYIASQSQKESFMEFFDKHGIPEESWKNIHAKMLGQPMYNLKNTIVEMGFKLKDNPGDGTFA